MKITIRSFPMALIFLRKFKDLEKVCWIVNSGCETEPDEIIDVECFDDVFCRFDPWEAFSTAALNRRSIIFIPHFLILTRMFQIKTTNSETRAECRTRDIHHKSLQKEKRNRISQLVPMIYNFLSFRCLDEKKSFQISAKVNKRKCVGGGGCRAFWYSG